MSFLRVGALWLARAFRVVSIREAYPFPTLLLCCFRCITRSLRLARVGKEFVMQLWEQRLGVLVEPFGEQGALAFGLKTQFAFFQRKCPKD